MSRAEVGDLEDVAHLIEDYDIQTEKRKENWLEIYGELKQALDNKTKTQFGIDILLQNGSAEMLLKVVETILYDSCAFGFDPFDEWVEDGKQIEKLKFIQDNFDLTKGVASLSAQGIEKIIKAITGYEKPELPLTKLEVTQLRNEAAAIHKKNGMEDELKRLLSSSNEGAKNNAITDGTNSRIERNLSVAEVSKKIIQYRAENREKNEFLSCEDILQTPQDIVDAKIKALEQEIKELKTQRGRGKGRPKAKG